VGNLVPPQGSNASDGGGATTDMLSNPEGDVDNTSEIKTSLNDDESENDVALRTIVFSFM
jgi:hypothetical protein